MLEKNNIEKILGVFFDHPTREFHIRELARRSGISAPTILLAVNILLKKNLIDMHKKGNMKIVKASGSTEFIRIKRIENIRRVYESGIIDYLRDLYEKPMAIILFGSFSRGDDTEKSDIDIAVVTKQHEEAGIDLYEKKFNRKISIHEVDVKKISKEFYSNLANGIVMDGAM